MNKIINPIIQVKLQKFLYRFRFLGLYIVFGILSLIIEILIRSFLISYIPNHNAVTIISIICGILFAFFANDNFNFKIPKSRKKSALIYFLIISFFSASFQWLLWSTLNFSNFNYESGRFTISGFFFLIAYIFHRKYSFRDFKKVGVAIYANGSEDLEDIYDRIGLYPDFIHVDIVDSTMSVNAEDVQIHRMETMKAYWPYTQIQTHIMSMDPSKWIDQALIFSDVVYIHSEIKHDITSIFDKIKKSGKKAGLAFTMSTNPKDELELLKMADYVLLLTIPEPGSSGQKFDTANFKRIKELNSLSFRNEFVLCVDGGVNENIISFLSAENIVSGSSVLNNASPKQQIMRLQTSGRYEI